MEIKKAADEFLFYLEIERNVSTHTYRSYAYDLQLFCSFLRQVHNTNELEYVQNSTVRRFIQEQVLQKKTRPKTMQRRISCLKSFSRFCAKEGWIDHDFMVGIQSPKSDKKLPVYLTISELQKLFHSLENDQGKFCKRNELMIKLLATTGMRRQELVDLCWMQLDFDWNTIRVHGKGNKERLVPLHPMVLPLFVSYRQELDEYQLHPTQPVFYNYKGQRLDPHGLHRIFKEELKKAGLPPSQFSLHHLRHTFATLLLQQQADKVDIRTLQELLGHESLSTTSIYTHVDFDQKRKAIQALSI
ncbi:tyrosine-type recombinase/integrase [Brevibacillus sp. SYSU BS000544]|uniref:tyrosine-type recombinase/integrase n=1 Tax=Brevibacillus sp. SYSU BS000544 TaxID=3416443 RepID=UPI003CE48FB9